MTKTLTASGYLCGVLTLHA